MSAASKKFRDKPLTALETGKWWVEYVLRNKDISHIQSAALGMSFIELNNLDVYVIIFLILMLLSMIPIYGLKKMFLLCRSKFSGKTEKLKSN
jgi:glucuronosyltransferase